MDGHTSLLLISGPPGFVAQFAEQEALNFKVAGSIPAESTLQKLRFRKSLGFSILKSHWLKKLVTFKYSLWRCHEKSMLELQRVQRRRGV